MLPTSSSLNRYITGKLDLPIVNPVNEGLTAFIIVSLVSGIVGNYIWNEEIEILNITFLTLIVSIFVTIMGGSILLK